MGIAHETASGQGSGTSVGSSGETPDEGSNRANERLVDLLAELGWSARDLAGAINDELGPGYVARTSVNGWIYQGRVPRDPLPVVVAHVLCCALGRPVSPDELWGRNVRLGSSYAFADDELPAFTAPGATVEVARQWVVRDGSDMRRRTFLAITGAALTDAVFPPAAVPQAAAPRPVTVPVVRGAVITPAVCDSIEASVAALRVLDDAEGGDESTLDYARRQFTLVAEGVRADRYTDSVTQIRAVNLWAQAAGTLGWVAMDADDQGLAQRFFLTGLNAAHTSGDPALMSHLFGCLTYQAVALKRKSDVMDLANASIAAARSAPPATRALAAARHAHAHALLGDIHGLRQSTDEAYRHLDHPDAIATRPPWLYWLTDLTVVTGQSLITAGLATNLVGSRRGAALLAEADQPITGWLGPHAERTMDRDALLHGTWLARSYLSRGEVEQAVATTTSLLEYSSTVRSTHTRTILCDLDGDLARRDLRTRPDVAHLRKQLKTLF